MNRRSFLKSTITLLVSPYLPNVPLPEFKPFGQARSYDPYDALLAATLKSIQPLLEERITAQSAFM